MGNVKKIEPHQYSECDKVTRKLTGVVLIFHPQCGHCVQMRPAWESMKKRVPPHVKIVEVNGSGMSESPLLSGSVIGKHTEGYPSIIRLRNGQYAGTFRGERTPEKFRQFVVESSPLSKRVRKVKSRNRKPNNKGKSRRKN